ncbi:MAG: NAD(P)-binding domain-containing protein, partial [Terrimicrobiaceae bacterium]
MKTTIGFVGTGRMGANMARRLNDQGFSVTAVYDLDSESAGRLAAEIGATACGTLAQVTAAANVIITVVSDDKAQRGIFVEKADNLLDHAKGKLFINCATVTPSLQVEIEKLVGEAGASSLEACMASSITQAR